MTVVSLRKIRILGNLEIFMLLSMAGEVKDICSLLVWQF